MTIHLTIWWLWWTLIAVYVVGVLIGMFMTMIADDMEWWLRPLILIWPLTLTVLVLWHLALFLVGQE